MRQLDIGKWKADNLKEFSERVVLALCTPQKERFTRVSGWLDKIDSSGEDVFFILNLSCFAKFHPYHPDRAEECVEYSDVMQGSRSDKYESFHPAIHGYFDRILESIKNYSADLYDMIAHERQVVDRKTLSLKLSLLEQV